MDLIKTEREATRMSPEEISRIWNLMPESPFRVVFEYALSQQVLQKTSELLMKKDFGEIRELQGVIHGLKLAQNILKREDKVLTSTQR